MIFSRKPRAARRAWLYPLLGLAAAVAIAAGVWHWRARESTQPELAAGVDLLNPDAFLRTESLSQLPKDLLAAPLLRDLATEDLFFYYREDEGRLGLEGALRRIGFEHELSLGDRVVALILDRPAQVAFWKSRDGRLGRWLLIVRREGLLPILEALSKAALADRQLRSAGTLPGRADAPVFELRHARRLKLYLASAGDFLWVSSDPGLLLPADEPGRDRVGELLDAANPAELLAQGFQLGTPPHRHTLAISASYLGLGYQTLFPALRGVRFDYDAGGWTAAVAASEPFPPASRVWAAVPDHPALCAAVPVDPERVARLLSGFAQAEAAGRIASALEPPAALCWYAKAKLHTPLVAIRKKSAAPLDADLRNLFAAAIGTREAGVEQPAPPPAGKPEGEDAENTVVVYHPPFAVEERKTPSGTLWRREVSSPHGTRPSEDSGHGGDMRSPRYFTVALAEWQDALLFSPDAGLVDDALAALEGRYPALADALPEGSETALAVYPDRLAGLVETAVLDSLPDRREPVFRANVSEHLLPRLEKLKEDRLLRLPAPAGRSPWEPLRWAEPR